ncbi:hypothetical protein Tco_1543723, partial [Tanacetum coccineum]
MLPKPDLSFFGLEEFTSEPIVTKPVVETSEDKASTDKPKAVRKNNVNTLRQVNAAHTKTTVNATRPMPKAVVNAARPKAVVNAVKGNNVNAVKASACWVWKPKNKVLYHVSKHNSASITLNKFDYVDAQGRSKEHVLPILLTLKKLIEDMLPLEVTLKEGKSQAE